jgi:hypothetical protein
MQFSSERYYAWLQLANRNLFRLYNLVRHLPRTITIAVVVGVAGGLGFFLLHALSRPAHSTQETQFAQASADDLLALQSRVAELEQAVTKRNSVERLPEPRVQEATEAVSSRRMTAPFEHSRSQTVEDEATQELRQIHELDELAKTEPRDRSWASSYEEKIRDAVESTVSKDAGATIGSLSCGTSICRLELSHETAIAQARFLEQFQWKLPAKTGAHFYTGSPTRQGLAITVVHLVREGYPIPGGN